MKRLFAGLLAALILLSLCGCAGEQPAAAVQPEETEAVTSESTQAASEAAQPEETEPPVDETLPLYLKYASVTMSVVGETDDIYLGTVPREDITWESDDPSIVSVENGRITANAVGTTTVRAVYGSRQAECAVGCLAKDKEALCALDEEVLSLPKRLPVAVDLEEPCTLFDDAAILGDSITYFMMQWEAQNDALGKIVFLTRNGVSLSSFVLNSKSIVYRGKETPPQTAIAQSGVSRVYILMGALDGQASTLVPSIMRNWEKLLQNILEANPDLEIVIISNIPSIEDSAQKTLQSEPAPYNALITENNVKIRELAQKYGCMYLDLYSYVEDHSGQMPKSYSRDVHHLNEEGSLAWMQVMRWYAQYEADGGSLYLPEPEDTDDTQEAAEAAYTLAPGIPNDPAIQSDAHQGPLFLKVSSVNMSLVGHSEDIYLGTIPREEITWSSDNPEIISVEDGVLTAKAVGSTTIHGTYSEWEVSCLAGCLAENEEALAELPKAVLSSPKRLPPAVDLKAACTIFDDAALVGDSVSYNLMQWETPRNTLGDILFLARGGVSMNGFARRYKNIIYRGKEMYLEDAIGKSGVNRVYFLMGSNDIQAVTQSGSVFKNWDIMVERIREKNPNAELILMSSIPLFYEEKPSSTNSATQYNQRIEAYNTTLRQFAAENDCRFIDLHYYIEDHYGRMPDDLNQGEYHMNGAGCETWAKILRYYAQYQFEGGTLS